MNDNEALAFLERAAASPRVAAGLLDLVLGHVVAVRRYRVEVARRLVRDGMPRREAREVLQRRFGVSRRTAYRLLDAAHAG